MNYETEALQDANVRRAIAGAIDRENFTKVLMNGNGSPAVGPFPASFAYGDTTVTAQPFDLEASRAFLAESVQATMKEIGIDLQVNCTANHLDFIDSGDWDIYASAFVTAPTGDPEFFFTTHCLDASSKNRGKYHSDELEALEEQMSRTCGTSM